METPESAETAPLDNAPEENQEETPPTVEVTAPAPITASSTLSASSRDVELRPLNRPGDVAEVMPGLFAVQHAGGGKANQYFVRGFDADHGTDIALSIDGVPVNMVSHAHGQGYADLHFLIPELVASVDARKGPYEAMDGDFATAGAIDMHLLDRVPESYVRGTFGSFNTGRGLAVVGANRDETHGILAGEIYTTEGPFTHSENLQRYNLYGKVSTRWRGLDLSLGGSAYGSGWDASGQNPLRAVEDGSLSYWGTEDTSQGGQSTRRQLWGHFFYAGDASSLEGVAWMGTYNLNLYSNFTFFAVDPVNGDEIEQTDNRQFSGFDLHWQRVDPVGPLLFSTRVGTQGRQDLAETGLYHDTARSRLSTTVDAEISEDRLGIYMREEVTWSRWARLIGGVRFDHFDFSVNDHVGEGDGVKDAMTISPKVNLIVNPTPWMSLFLNWGRGFHSNDARGVVRSEEPVTPLTTATGEEAGLLFHHSRWGQLALTGWMLDMEQETVWVGDEGTTELNGPTHRQGFDLSLRATPLSWLQADLDLNLAKATYTENAGNGGQVALAPTFTMAGGIGILHPSGFSGGARVRSIAARPATEDGSLEAEGWTILDAEVGYRWRFMQLQLQCDNLLNTPWKEVQFASDTRLKDEPEVVQDITFTPGWPRTFLVSLQLYR